MGLIDQSLVNDGTGGDFIPTGAPLVVKGPDPETAPAGMKFDGSNDYLTRGAELTGVVDGQRGIFSGWMRLDGDDGIRMDWFQSSTARMTWRRQANNTIKVWLFNSARVTIWTWTTASTFTASASYFHILASWDLGNNFDSLYINDVLDGSRGTFINDTIDYTDINLAIGAKVNGMFKLNGALAELYLNTAETADITLESNRRRFIDGAGNPVDLGSDGSTPTGTAPAIYYFNNDLKTEAQKKSPKIYPVLEVEFASGTKRYASTGTGRSTGLYQNKVMRWPILTRSAGESLESINFSVTIDDTDFEFSNLTATDGIKALRGVGANIKLVSPNVTDANSFTVFTGKLVGFQPAGPLQWRYDFRSDDKQLEQKYPKTKINLADWRNADPAALDKPAPLIVGIHDAQGITTGGMVPVLYVDNVGFRYMVAAGYVQVDNVYKDGTEQTSGWTETHVTVSGRDYTLIDFTSDQGAADITANVTGYDTDADGGGTVFANPADELKHLLVQYIFGDHKAGAWLADATAPINVTHLTEAADFLDILDAEGSRRIAERQVSGVDTINEWLANHHAVAFWQNDGKLGVRPDDLFITTIYYDDAWIRWERQPGSPGDFKQEYDDANVVDTYDVSYMYGAADSKFFDAIQVRDPSVGEGAHEPLPLVWSVSRIQ